MTGTANGGDPSRAPTHDGFPTPIRGRVLPRVVFHGRATLFSHPGGDTVVVRRLLASLEALGVHARFTPQRGIGAGTDVVHTVDLGSATTRACADDAARARVPLVVTTRYDDAPRVRRVSTAAAALFRLAIDARGARRATVDRRALAAAVARMRDPEPPSHARVDEVAALARVLVCCGPSERRRLVADHPGAADVRVIPLAAELLDTEPALAPGTFAATYGVRDYVLCVARLEARKNQLMLLEALHDDARPAVLVTGGFCYDPDYARLCATFRRRGPTVLLDRLPAAMLAAAYREAAVHCLPSWHELPGLTSLEAAAHGTRVAASSWGALADYLGDSVAYLEPDQPASVRSAITAALALDPAPATIRARAFSWARTARATLALYEEIASGTGATTPAATIPDRLSAGFDGGATASLADAERARATGDWESVLRHADVAAAAGAEPATVTELRAVAHSRRGRLDDAERDFAALLAVAPYRSRAEAGLGIIALARGDDVTARAWLERATAAAADADAWAALGLCLGRLAETEASWQAYAAARVLDPSHRMALHGLVTLAAAVDRLDELEAHLRDYLTRVGDDADVRYALAGCLYAAGRRDESRATVRDVLRTAPAHALARALDRELTA